MPQDFQDWFNRASTTTESDKLERMAQSESHKLCESPLRIFQDSKCEVSKNGYKHKLYYRFKHKVQSVINKI